MDVIKIASYISERFQKEYHVRIDEMKLHKLLYFTQREAIVETGYPMFEEKFVAMKYGPVMISIRENYKNNELEDLPSQEFIDKNKSIFDMVFLTYANRESMSLSDLSHGEESWINARKRIGTNNEASSYMLIEDIKKDAERIKFRRNYFNIITSEEVKK